MIARGLYGSALLVVAACLTLAGCGGGHGSSRETAVAPPPDLVKALQVPENPYRLIYTAPVSLAKPPDTTASARRPRH